MKISLNWIRDYVSLPAELSPEQIAYDLTMATVEVEGVAKLADDLGKLVVAKVAEVKQHPNADRLVVAVCETGGESVEVVCGGANVQAGMSVAFAPVGAMVYWHGEPDRTELKAAKVRGVLSQGMICAADEIGLGELFECGEKEILDLSSFSAQPGAPLADVLELDDVVLEIDNKSITNRPDLWGHYGIARELSAIYGGELLPIEPFDFKDVSATSRVISELPQCLRFTETKIGGTTPEESPFWLRSRLARVGQRPINFLVDLTNYVMLALGQPMHAFDGRRIQGGLRVRFVQPGDSLKLLDQTEAAIDEHDLVVADDDGAVALAGVMGGEERSIADDTQDMILEVANFDASSIRRTATRLGVRTESSSRFEKGLDPNLVESAVSMFLSMLQKQQPSAQVTAYTDHYPRPQTPGAIEVSYEFLDWRLGENIPHETILQYLRRLGFTVVEHDEGLAVTPPSWRATGDIALPEDIVEEIARLHGYEQFTFQPPQIALTAAINQRDYRCERSVREFLAATAGMQEVCSYPWVQDQYLEAAGVDKSTCLELAAPPAPDVCRLQPSLIPQLLRTASENLRFEKEFRVFELARVFRSDGQQDVGKADDKLPSQPKLIGGMFVGTNPQHLYRAAKGVLDGLVGSLGRAELACVPSSDLPWGEPNLQMELRLGSESIGHLAVVARKTRLHADIKHSHLVAFELELPAIQAAPVEKRQFESLPEYPQVVYDISFLFDFSTPWSEVAAAADGRDPLVRSVEFVDEYTGKGIDKDKKSLTMRLLIGSPDRTLTSEEVEQVVSNVSGHLAETFNAVQRT